MDYGVAVFGLDGTPIHSQTLFKGVTESDPLHPHPYIEDIRVVFGACMIQDKVHMLTNEMQAREWMERVVKRGVRDFFLNKDAAP